MSGGQSALLSRIDTSPSPLFHHHSRNPSVVPVDKLDPITHQHVVKAADALEQEFEGLYTRAVIDPVVAEGCASSASISPRHTRSP